MLATWWSVGNVLDPYEYIDMSGLIYIMLMTCLTGWCYGSVLKFQLERPVYLREQAN